MGHVLTRRLAAQVLSIAGAEVLVFGVYVWIASEGAEAERAAVWGLCGVGAAVLIVALCLWPRRL